MTIPPLFSQELTTFKKPSDSIHKTIFPPKLDIVLIHNFQILDDFTFNKLPNPQNVNLLPQNYSWTNDAFKAQSLRKMALENQTQDLNGRDLPTDIYQEVPQNAYLKNPNPR